MSWRESLFCFRQFGMGKSGMCSKMGVGTILSLNQSAINNDISYVFFAWYAVWRLSEVCMQYYTCMYIDIMQTHWPDVPIQKHIYCHHWWSKQNCLPYILLITISGPQATNIRDTVFNCDLGRRELVAALACRIIKSSVHVFFLHRKEKNIHRFPKASKTIRFC